MSRPFIAVDWGTTNRRAYLIDVREVLRTERDDIGAMGVKDFPAEAARLRSRFGDFPLVMAGMVGSNIGWSQAGYVPVPAGISRLGDSLHYIDAMTAIVPGLSVGGNDPKDGFGDVMRGEEVQLLGAVEAGLVPADALLCQPGTHCKWAWLEDGEVVRFVTAMTGELFALLRADSLIAPMLKGAVDDMSAFSRGVDHGARRDLSATLFSIRSGGLLGSLSEGEAPSFLSGVLIGADVHARLDGTAAPMVHILADPVLGELYAAAIAQLGGTSTLVDSHAAFVAGICAIWENAK